MKKCKCNCFELNGNIPPYAMLPRLLSSDSWVSSSAKILYVILKIHQLPDKNGKIKQYVFPSRERLARMMNVTTRCIDRLRKELRDAGWIIEKTNGRKIFYWFSWPYIKTPDELMARFNYLDFFLREEDVFGINSNRDNFEMKHSEVEVDVFYKWFDNLEIEKRRRQSEF